MFGSDLLPDYQGFLGYTILVSLMQDSRDSILCFKILSTGQNFYDTVFQVFLKVKLESVLFVSLSRQRGITLTVIPDVLLYNCMSSLAVLTFGLETESRL